MPPKAKLHKEKGKLTCLPQIHVAENGLGSAEQSQFELELCWCVQQLQHALASGKLTTKQVQDTTKTMNTLMSSSAPLVRKRQLMRLSFGDYRAKMAEEEKKYNKINHQMKLSTAKPSKKSVFVKKAPFLTSDKTFKFNFNIPPEEQAVQQINNLHLEKKEVENETFHFRPSDNAFRFNFSEFVE